MRQRPGRRFRIVLVLAATVAALALAPAALAADSSLSVYGGGQVPLVEAKGKGPASLPFTGLGIGIMAITGGALIATGLTARRFTASRA